MPHLKIDVPQFTAD